MLQITEANDGTGARKSPLGRPPRIHPVGKPAFARLARARKRHYTFARWSLAVFLVEPARRTNPFKVLIRWLNFVSSKRGSGTVAGFGCVEAGALLPSSIG